MIKKAMVLVSMVAIVAVMVAGFTGAFGTGDSPTVFASSLAGIAGAGTSGIQIQNLDASQDAQIVSDFYNQKGGGAISIARPNIAAGSAANIYLPAESSLTNGAYAAIISADRQIAAIARTDWNNTGGAAIYSNVQPGTDVSLPLAAKGYAGQTTLASIQNTDTSQSASVTVDFYIAGETTAAASATIQILPGTSQTIDLGKSPNFAAVPDGSLGSMKISSTSIPVGVQAFMDIETQDKAVYAYEGVPSEQAADTLYSPLIRNGFFGTSGISVVNPGASPVDVTVTYYASPGADSCSGTYVHNNGAQTIAAGSSAVFYQGNVAGLDTGDSTLPVGCFGSAVIESSGGNVLAIVNDADLGAGTSAAYNAVSQAGGATKVALPLFRKEHVAQKLTTGIQAMNIGSSPANVTLSVAGDGIGTIPASLANATIAPNASQNWFPSGAAEWDFVPSNSYGSATIESDQPIIVIVNDFSTNGMSDSAIYNGIKAD